MEQFFALRVEVEIGVDVDKIRMWLDIVLHGKVEFQYFIANQVSSYAGWGAIEGNLFVRHPVPLSVDEMEGFLGVPNEVVKEITIKKVA